MKKLTQNQFNKAVLDTKKKPKTVKMAEEVLVGGKSPTTVAKQNNVKRQQVADACTSIYNTHLENIKAPSDWIQITAVFPPKEAKEVLKKSKNLLIEYHHKNKK